MVCSTCAFWRHISDTSKKTPFACHCYLQTGVRNGKQGDECSTYVARRRKGDGTGKEGAPKALSLRGQRD